MLGRHQSFSKSQTRVPGRQLSLPNDAHLKTQERLLLLLFGLARSVIIRVGTPIIIRRACAQQYNVVRVFILRTYTHRRTIIVRIREKKRQSEKYARSVYITIIIIFIGTRREYHIACTLQYRKTISQVRTTRFNEACWRLIK